MATAIHPELRKQLGRYGAGCVDDCFNCGNCTAVCPLSQGEVAFPRKMVRYVQLGLKDRLAGSIEPWLCYYCGECSATCPRDATPGETMAALRRHATASYDLTGLAGLMYQFPWIAMGVTVLLAIGLGVFHLAARFAHHDGLVPDYWQVFSWIPYNTIHMIGMIVGGIMMMLIAAGVINAARLMLRSRGGFGWFLKQRAHWIPAAIGLVREIAVMKRHHECGDSEDGGPPEPKHLTARTAHLAIMWGFGLLLLATTIDFVFVFMLGIEPYIVARPIGIIGGLVMLYGLLVFTRKRLRKETPGTAKTTFADAWLLAFLIVLDLTGFVLLAIVSFRIEGVFSDVVLLLHSVLAMEMVLLFTLSKLGHALFRPMALFIRSLEERAAA